MATYNEIYNLRFASATLKTKTVVAIAKAGIAIVLEDPATANHAQRLLWAKRALLGTIAEAEYFLWPVVTNATISAAGDAATDAQVQSVVDAAINTIASTVTS